MPPYIILTYLIAINILTFIVYGNDKRKARKNKWRTPESTLLMLAFIGGAYGAWLGMTLFRHKTKHWKFRILVPLMAAVWTVLLVYFATCSI